MINQEFEQLLRQHLKYLPPSAALDDKYLLKDYGLDSMAAIDLLLDIEDTYNIMMPEEYLTEETFSTAYDLWKVVERLRNTAAERDNL